MANVIVVIGPGQGQTQPALITGVQHFWNIYFAGDMIVVARVDLQQADPQ